MPRAKPKPRKKSSVESRLRGNDGLVPSFAPASRKSPRKTAPATFSAPLLGDEALAPALIGEITHYYDKIKVGVIKLSATLSIGDRIAYQTADAESDEPYEQIIESMEIDRVPVFTAGRGKEIGLKLKKTPRVGGAVFICS